MALMTIIMAEPFLPPKHSSQRTMRINIFFLRTRNVGRQIESGGENEPKEEAHSRAFRNHAHAFISGF